MMTVLSLLLFISGLTLIVNSFMKPAYPEQEFTRYGASPPRSGRIWPRAIGATIALGGIAILLLTRTDLP